MGEQYEEYYLDDEAVQQTIIDLFYEEQKNEYIAGKEEKKNGEH